MKKVILLIVLSLIIELSALAQHATIKADRVKYHIGENVTVIDSITSVNMKNDSIAVINVGGASGKVLLQVIVKFPFFTNPGGDFFKALKNSLLEIKGRVVLTNKNPTMIIYHKDSLYFFSPVINKNWALLSEQAVKKLRR